MLYCAPRRSRVTGIMRPSTGRTEVTKMALGKRDRSDFGDLTPPSPVSGGGRKVAGAGKEPSLRERLKQYFLSGQNGSDRELAALFGASVGSISVYRCQLKKLGVGMASPPAPRSIAAGKKPERPRARAKSGKAKPATPAAAGGGHDRDAGRAAPKGRGRSEINLNRSGLSLGENDQVLVRK